MDQKDYTTVRRFIDLSVQADKKGIVVFSDFLNMNEVNLLHQNKEEYSSIYTLWGGYDNAERQMVAFQPDALYYTWDYPVSCVAFTPVHQKYAEQLTHRDVLGALMNLGIERSTIGDIVFQKNEIYVFCLEKIASYLVSELYKIKHTQVNASIIEPTELCIEQEYKEESGVISSNRLDAFVSLACKLSRGKAADYIFGENVFIDGKSISNHNQKLVPGSILSLRGYGKLELTDIGDLTKKGRMRVAYRWYK